MHKKEERVISKLLIVGAGGHGRCCLDIAREIYDEVSFLDDNLDIKQVNDCDVIGTINEMNSFYLEYTKVFIAVGNNEFRDKLINQALEIGYEVVSLISSKAIVSKYASVGVVSVIFPNVVINANVFIGAGCIVSSNAVVDHDSIVGNYCHINALGIVPSMNQVPEYTKVDYGQVYRKLNEEEWKKEYIKQFGKEPSFF